MRLRADRRGRVVRVRQPVRASGPGHELRDSLRAGGAHGDRVEPALGVQLADSSVAETYQRCAARAIGPANAAGTKSGRLLAPSPPPDREGHDFGLRTGAKTPRHAL